MIFASGFLGKNNFGLIRMYFVFIFWIVFTNKNIQLEYFL
jgi:hypothetical protein